MMKIYPQKTLAQTFGYQLIRIISRACQLKTSYSGHLKVKVIYFYPFQPQKEKLHFAKAHQKP